MGLFGKLLRLFITFKLIQLVLIYFTPAQFDTSSQIIIDNLPKSTSPYNAIITTILNRLIVWDSVYFNDLFVNPIRYEHQFVFCPGWIKLVQAVAGDTNNYYVLQFTSVVMSNMFHFISVILLYYLTNEINGGGIISYYSSLFFIISPAGVFLTTNYSENFSNFLTLLALLAYFKAVNFNDVNQVSNKSIRNKALYVASGVVCAVAFTVRANSLFLGILYLLDLYHFWQNSKKPIRCDAILLMGYAVLTGSLLFCTFVGTNVYHYLKFCPGRGEWCNYAIPSLFQYAQDHYWNVGFLKYWTANNIPNFLLVLPVLLFNIYAIVYMVGQLPKYRKLMPIIIINAMTVFGGVFFWNVQILNRITSFSPLLYWTLADHHLGGKYWIKYAVYYSLLWSCIQAVLFAGFLPPA
ncbi:GPI mannosyltransferase 2 [Candida viswanathii]|uniref:GPI mannosyltransferase 2 n=1 Tax=Candida viswanathii TaxID=5486 RepID=A0A367Y4K2_9ASCO|nr:GPI mannosyltransferase 2 [Candida viswanathii]